MYLLFIFFFSFSLCHGITQNIQLIESIEIWVNFDIKQRHLEMSGSCLVSNFLLGPCSSAFLTQVPGELLSISHRYFSTELQEKYLSIVWFQFSSSTFFAQGSWCRHSSCCLAETLDSIAVSLSTNSETAAATPLGVMRNFQLTMNQWRDGRTDFFLID